MQQPFNGFVGLPVYVPFIEVPKDGGTWRHGAEYAQDSDNSLCGECHIQYAMTRIERIDLEVFAVGLNNRRESQRLYISHAWEYVCCKCELVKVGEWAR